MCHCSIVKSRQKEVAERRALQKVTYLLLLIFNCYALGQLFLFSLNFQDDISSDQWPKRQRQ